MYTICFWVLIISTINIIMTKANDTLIDTSMLTVLQAHEDDLYYKADLEDFDWGTWCKMQPNGYQCTDHGETELMYYYDLKLQGCKTFDYGKCPINVNGFASMTECKNKCQDAALELLPYRNVSAKIFCLFQPDFGNCDDYHPMFYYDLTTHTCRGFSYSGCGGNANRFFDSRLCSSVCSPVIPYV